MQNGELPPELTPLNGTTHERWRAVLREVVTMMRTLIERGEAGHIDLIAEQLSEDDYVTLRERLGEGDLVAEFGEDGTVELVQTAHDGVWWVTYRDAQGGVIGDFIEVAYCPEALIPGPDEVHESMEALQARMLEGGFTQPADLDSDN